MLMQPPANRKCWEVPLHPHALVSVGLLPGSRLFNGEVSRGFIRLFGDIEVTSCGGGRNTAMRQTPQSLHQPQRVPSWEDPSETSQLVRDGQAFIPCIPLSSVNMTLLRSRRDLGQGNPWVRGWQWRPSVARTPCAWGNMESGLGGTFRFSTQLLFFCELYFYFILFPPQ